jgi:hypothetical protein
METIPLRISETIGKIHELAEYRESCIRENHEPPIFRHVAAQLEVSAEEVHTYAPELYMQWYDTEFHWKLPTEHPFH